MLIANVEGEFRYPVHDDQHQADFASAQAGVSVVNHNMLKTPEELEEEEGDKPRDDICIEYQTAECGRTRGCTIV